jgi:hypothetical protein
MIPEAKVNDPMTINAELPLEGIHRTTLVSARYTCMAIS